MLRVRTEQQTRSDEQRIRQHQTALRILRRRGNLRRHYPRTQDPFFDPCRHYFETVFIAGAFALREVLVVRPFLAIARATRVTLLITFALDNGEALTVRTGAMSYKN